MQSRTAAWKDGLASVALVLALLPALPGLGLLIVAVSGVRVGYTAIDDQLLYAIWGAMCGWFAAMPLAVVALALPPRGRGAPGRRKAATAIWLMAALLVLAFIAFALPTLGNT